ncbi:TPA: DUF4976 domain-containing protein [Candidatus Poribacteria bacterium]|nr:DUF4976 domain-containing protein [Candidatus Poribacteria bacterium]
MEQPNILLLLTDQQRYDALSCNGADVCQTPAVDEIAANGVRFTHAYTPISLCSPARASILTGLYAHNHGQLANMGNFNGAFADQVLSQTVYPQLLAEVGYQTSCIGKWHLAKEDDTQQWGFHNWRPFVDWNLMLRAEGIDFQIARDEVQRLEWGGDAPFYGRAKLPADKMMEAWVADQAIDLISASADSNQPFMIAANFFGPHFPYAVPAPYDTMYDPDLVKRWNNFDDQFINKPSIQQKEMLRWNASHLTWVDWQKVIAAYWGFCTYIDDQVQRILDCLKETEQWENTVIVFSSDHGDMLGSHRLFNKGFHMYEETHRIPLVISPSSKTQNASICEQFVSLVDLMPTFLELAGAKVPDHLDGQSLSPFLTSQEVTDWRDDVFAEFHGYESTLASVRMVRTKSWKYVYNPYSEDELYDMVSDPGELHNLADQLGYKHILRRMKERLVNWMRQTNDSIVDVEGWKNNPYDLYVSGREF